MRECLRLPSGVRVGVTWVLWSKVMGDRGGCKQQWWATVGRYSHEFYLWSCSPAHGCQGRLRVVTVPTGIGSWSRGQGARGCGEVLSLWVQRGSDRQVGRCRRPAHTCPACQSATGHECVWLEWECVYARVCFVNEMTEIQREKDLMTCLCLCVLFELLYLVFGWVNMTIWTRSQKRVLSSGSTWYIFCVNLSSVAISLTHYDCFSL